MIRTEVTTRLLALVALAGLACTEPKAGKRPDGGTNTNVTSPDGGEDDEVDARLAPDRPVPPDAPAGDGPGGGGPPGDVAPDGPVDLAPVVLDTAPGATCLANVPCTQGIAPCHKGATFCATPTSAAECKEAGVDDQRGGCTGSNVCKAGDCVAPCKGGVACTQGIAPCRKGATFCASPTSDPVCNESGNDDSRQNCSGGNICKGGVCCSANVGKSCVGNNPCQTGTYDCAGVCHSQNVGGSCGTGAGCLNGATKQADYCQGGQCVSVAPIPCSGGKVCSSNKCMCPASKPVEQGGQCYLGENTRCTDVRDCLPGSDCEGLGVCTQDPFPTCFGSDSNPCPTGGNCVQYKPPESRCHHPM